MTVIAMTQEMATLGTDVAQGIAKSLGLKIVQHEVGDIIAERMQVKRSLIRRVREGQAGWLEKRGVDPDVFAVYAAEEVLSLAQEGNIVIRGWGATCILSGVSHIPCVRVCAPLEQRVRWLMERLDSDDADMAREEIERSDAAHAARIQQNFGVTLGDPLRYDIVAQHRPRVGGQLRRTGDRAVAPAGVPADAAKRGATRESGAAGAHPVGAQGQRRHVRSQRGGGRRGRRGDAARDRDESRGTRCARPRSSPPSPACNRSTTSCG